MPLNSAALAQVDRDRATARDSLRELCLAFADQAAAIGEDATWDTYVTAMLLMPEWGDLELAAVLVEAVAEMVRSDRPLG